MPVNMIDLNLYNFESKEAANYPYILTSPRSLKSCRLANVKPVELLQRTAQDISADFNIPLRNANKICVDYESERLRKLEICKMIRKHLTLDIRNEEVVLDDTKSLKQYLNENEQLENSPNYSRGNTPEFSRRVKQSRSCSPAPILSPIRQDAGSPVKKRRTKLSSLQDSTSSSETPSPFQSNEIERKYNLRRTKSADSNRHDKREEMCMKKSISFMPIIRKRNANYEFHTRNAESISTTPEKRSCRQADKMKKLKNDFSKQSQTEKKIHFEKRSQKHELPVKDCKKVLHTKVAIQKKPFNRKILSIRNDDKLPQNRDRVLYPKSHRNNSYNEIMKKRMVNNSRNSFDPVDSIKNHDIRILDAMFFNREKEQLERNFARKADLIWDTCGCKNFFIDKKANSSSKIRKYTPSGNDPDVCTCNENRMFNLYFQRIRNKMKQLKENSLNKELHSEQVRQLARELQMGMEQWQDQVLLLQWRALQKAKINAKLQLESRRMKTQTENNERTLLHALRFRNVQEMERIKQQIFKKEIEEKDSRIERLKIKREREIMDCKAQAQYTADLRDQLRRTLTPETFDRKVNDAMVKSKFITRALTSSPLIESHIRLG